MPEIRCEVCNYRGKAKLRKVLVDGVLCKEAFCPHCGSLKVTIYKAPVKLVNEKGETVREYKGHQPEISADEEREQERVNRERGERDGSQSDQARGGADS